MAILRIWALLATAAALVLGTMAWRLEGQLRDLRRAATAPISVSPSESPAAGTASPVPPVAARGTGLAGAGRLVGAIGASLRDATADAGPAPRGPNLVREVLGRRPGESQDAYRARVVPLVELALSRIRQRVADRRQEFEAAANLTAEQRASLDQALGEARTELVALGSKAIEAGELTPYRRNTLGLLSFAASASSVAEAMDARVRKVLGAEQLQILEQTGFDLVEYLGATAEWETMTPPPPP